MSVENAGSSRRSFFFQGGLVGGGMALGLQTSSAPSPTSLSPGSNSGHDATSSDSVVSGGGFDFTQESAALSPEEIVDTACQFCNSHCGMKVSLKSGRVIGISGEDEDRVQDGNLCVKAKMMPELVYNHHRITTPLRRVSGQKGSKDSRFEPVSWDEALRAIAEKMVGLRDAGEARAVANRTTGRMPRGSADLIARLFSLLGSPNNTDVGPVCNDAGANALSSTFGLGYFTNGYGVDEATGEQDLGSARYFLFLGTNQAETHPVTFEYLLRERARTGAKLVVVDPRLTPTGAQADLWVSPKPHTDQALVLAILYHVVAQNLYDRNFIDRWVVGFEELRRHLVDHAYTPEWAADVTGVPAQTIKQIAEEYASASPAAIVCNAGISHQLGAFDTYRCLAFLAAITGNIGLPGGGCNFMHNTWPGKMYLPPLESTVPETTEALPVGPDYFAESILEKKPYQLRAVITQGNPLLSSANTARVHKAFEKLDFYVYTGLFMEEAAYFADIILPVCSGLEMEGVYMRRDDRAIRWQNQAVPRVGESRPDWEIWIDLAHTLEEVDTSSPRGYWANAFPAEWKDYRTLWSQFVAHTPGMKGMDAERMSARREPLRWPCPGSEHPGVSTLYMDHPSWYEAADSLGEENKGKRFLTPSGKVEIHTEELEEALAGVGHSALPIFYTHPEVTGGHPTIEYTNAFVTNPLYPHANTVKVRLGVQAQGDVHRDYPLMGMTGRPSVVHFASVTQWTPTGKQLNGVRLIQIHPRTAQRNGIAEGEQVRVESPRGAVTGTALLWEGIREDTIFVPSTFGPSQAVGDVSGADRYESANLLTDDRYFDNVSGQQAYKCFACRVTKA
ncbi:molybdopterin-dependent oxidoreductase [Nocardiopsis akebiae]|uniref:Molybdopterin-dependent oxidoreductase n=2 Tax=Nocardiopsis akebiae TaxID=2831968 RepID=A0ABX8C9P4_9ACTN|nr:molybdopterin-dependent oxidoreductase [Nocardiopsis akebiae]